MRFVSNEQIVNELKKLMIDKGISQKAVSDRLGILPQGFTNLMNKKNFSFIDVQRILLAMDCDLDFSFVDCI